MSADLWQRSCERLAAELPEQQFNTWIRPLASAEISDRGNDGAVVTLRVPNRFKLDWIRNQYAVRIEAVLAELAGKPVRLDIALAARDAADRRGAGLVGDARRGTRSRRERRCRTGRGDGGTYTSLRRQRQRPRASVASSAQSRADVRHSRAREGEPDGSHGRASRRRRTGPDVQPAFHLWRSGPGQDASDPRGRQRAARRQARCPRPLPACRAVHHRRGEELPEKDFRRVEGENITSSTCC